MIVANSTFHWRSNATNLLSEEFLALVRSRLQPGGLYYYNTTGSDRVVRTGASFYPHALTIGTFLAVSDRPLVLDRERLRSVLLGLGVRADAVLNQLPQMATRDVLLTRPSGAWIPIRDDNMGTEWEKRR